MKLSDREIYVSIDIETDGPCPGVNSMIQLGAVIFNWQGKVVQRLSYNIVEQPGTVKDAKTMDWWSREENRDIYSRIVSAPDRNSITEALSRFDEALKSWGKIPVAICYPAGFDFSWIYVLFHKYLGRCPFSFSRVIDIKSLAWSLLDTRDYSDTAKRNFPRDWFSNCGEHTHDALADAEEQGRLFFNIVEWAQRRRNQKDDDHK